MFSSSKREATDSSSSSAPPPSGQPLELLLVELCNWFDKKQHGKRVAVASAIVDDLQTAWAEKMLKDLLDDTQGNLNDDESWFEDICGNFETLVKEWEALPQTDDNELKHCLVVSLKSNPMYQAYIAIPKIRSLIGNSMSTDLELSPSIVLGMVIHLIDHEKTTEQHSALEDLLIERFVAISVELQGSQAAPHISSINLKLLKMLTYPTVLGLMRSQATHPFSSSSSAELAIGGVALSSSSSILPPDYASSSAMELDPALAGIKDVIDLKAQQEELLKFATLKRFRDTASVLASSHSGASSSSAGAKPATADIAKLTFEEVKLFLKKNQPLALALPLPEVTSDEEAALYFQQQEWGVALPTEVASDSKMVASSSSSQSPSGYVKIADDLHALAAAAYRATPLAATAKVPVPTIVVPTPPPEEERPAKTPKIKEADDAPSSIPDAVVTPRGRLSPHP